MAFDFDVHLSSTKDDLEESKAKAKACRSLIDVEYPDTDAYNPKIFLIDRGYFTNESVFYIVDPSFYFRPLHFNLVKPIKINHFIFMAIPAGESMDKVFKIAIEDADNYPVILFQHHEGSIKFEDKIWNELEITEEEQLQMHCYNDLVVFKGVFKAEKEADGYRLQKVFNRFYFDWINK